MLQGALSACIVCKRGKKPCSFVPDTPTRKAPVRKQKRARSDSEDKSIADVREESSKRPRRRSGRAKIVSDPSIPDAAEVEISMEDVDSEGDSEVNQDEEKERLRKRFVETADVLARARAEHLLARAQLAECYGVSVTDV